MEMEKLGSLVSHLKMKPHRDEKEDPHEEKKSKMEPTYELLLYPIEKEFIGKIIIPTQMKNNSNKCKSNLATIVILDRSGSMGGQVARFVRSILPLVFQKLEYSKDDKIYLITFDSRSERFDKTVEELSGLSIHDQGSTYMHNAIKELFKLLAEIEKDSGIRLLTISDGEVYDDCETKSEADKLAMTFGKNFQINSQAVRLFTSHSQPDTTALSSLLQLNNVKKVNLLDLSSHLSDIEISSSIADLFNDDNMTYQVNMECEENIFKKCPWLSDFTNKITVFPGENVFWIEKVPTSTIKIDDIEVKINLQPELNLITYEKLLRKKMEQYMTQLKILKVVNTSESTTSMTSIVEYFKNREDYILNREENVQLLLNDAGLRSRMEYLKTLIDRRRKTFSMQMAQIANDDKVSELNAAQRADYLRTVENTKLSRGLARRAVNQGFDFNETLKNEVKKMAENIDELKNINDKDHEESFYSRAKTIDGIRILCELVKDDIIDELDANDILLIINLVGIPCSSPIGDFPDPMMWRVKEIHYGWYVSLSDVLTAHVQSKGEVFKTPATNKDINNVIPLFEDRKIITFLRKYAPSLIEYTASIGMRRMIVDIPMTCGYTLCAALWKAIEDLNKNKSELMLKTFERLLVNYEMYVQGYFKHILPYIKEQNNEKMSYYLANNGITNMLSPLITLYRENDENKLKFIPDILRALYTYEVWQAIRRLYKNKDNTNTIVTEMLTKLLGLDKEQCKTKVTPMYELDPEFSTIKFWDEPQVDEKYCSELTKNFYYVDYMTLIPKCFPAVINNKTETIVQMPALNETIICEQLDVSYNLKDFKLYNIVQALLFTTKANRVDEDNEKMKIIDLKYEDDVKNMMKDYVRKQFEHMYVTELTEKKKKQDQELSKLLVESIIRSTSRQKIVDLMRNGVKLGEVEMKLVNSSSSCVQDLKRCLVDGKQNIPLRCDIMRLFILCRDHLDNDSNVWNNGEINFVYRLDDFVKHFIENNRIDEWKEIMTEYKIRGRHNYRGKGNHRGHSNDKPSYYAYGFPNLQQYKLNVSSEEFDKYCSVHYDCCNVPQLLALMKKMKK